METNSILLIEILNSKMTKLIIILAWDKCPSLIELTKLQPGGEGLRALDVAAGSHSCEWGGILEARQIPQKLLTKFFHLLLILMLLT